MASQIRISPDIEGVPAISRGAGAPITSAGGSGGAGLGQIGYDTTSTDLTGAGGILGGLLGAAMAMKSAGAGGTGAGGTGSGGTRGGGAGGGGAGGGSGGGAGGGAGGQQTPQQADGTQIPVYDPQTGKLVGSTPQNAPFEPPGGFPSRTGNVYPEGIAGVQHELITLPPNVPNIEAQDYINDIYGTTRDGQPLMVAAGIADFNTNTIVAVPNLSIGPDFSKFERGTSDLFTGGGYDPTSVVTGVDMSTGRPYYGTDFSLGPDFTPTLGQSDLFTGGGYDPTTSPVIDVETFPYDFSFDISPSDMFDISGYDFSPSSWASNVGDWASDLSSSFGNTLADVGSSIGDLFDFGSWFGKDGGLATPMYAGGGEVKGYADGSSVMLPSNVIQDTSSPTGYSMFGLPVTASGVLYDANNSFTPELSSSVTGALDTIKNILTSSGAQKAAIGTALGAGLGSLLGTQTSRTPTGVDMSKIGVIQPRTTSFGMGPAKVVPYSQYSTPASSSSDYSQLMASLGAPTKMAKGGSTYYTYGKEMDPMENLRGFESEGMMMGDVMKSGGLPKATTPMTPEGRHDYRQGAYVDGIGDGQSDDIPAMLADGEYVIDSETVSALGNGSNKAGAKVLDQMRHGIRKHKRSASLDKIPPKAKSPLEYMRMGAKMKGAK